MNWNLVLSVEPIRLTVPMITTEMPAAMRPYSIAVAPDSSFRNASNFDITHSPCSWNSSTIIWVMMAGPYRRPVKKKLREWQGICLKLSLKFRSQLAWCLGEDASFRWKPVYAHFMRD